MDKQHSDIRLVEVPMSFEPTTKRPRLLSLMTSLLTIGAANGKMNLFTSSIRATTITSAWPLTSSPDPVIGTHDGSFHCDEALAIGMLKILPKFSNSFVVRTRKPELLAQCDIVVDVGAEYDPSRLRFDHHQRGFEHQFDGYKTKLSSAGLVYKHFGKDILSVIASSITDDEMEKSKLVSVSYEKIYKDFMEHIDAIDNGVSVADGDLKYHVSTTLSSRVGRLNPNWNEPSTSDDQNDRFKCAMELTCSEFLLHAESLMKVWWPARSIVQRAIANRHNVHESGKIILLDQFCPWKDHLFELEKEESVDVPILYALYQDSGGSWRIQAVPVDPESFDSRKKLPAEWCGLRDQQLSGKAGVPGAIFIHASGFIGGHSTKEGALEMTIKALSL